LGLQPGSFPISTTLSKSPRPGRTHTNLAVDPVSRPDTNGSWTITVVHVARLLCLGCKRLHNQHLMLNKFMNTFIWY